MAEFTNAKHTLRIAGVTPTSVGNMKRYYQYSNLADLKTAAQLADDAYLPYSAVKGKHASPTVKPYLIHNKSNGTDGFGFYDTATNTIVISFRGTQMTSPRDFWTDLNFPLTPIAAGSQYRVSSGFLSAYQSVDAVCRQIVDDACTAFKGVGNIKRLLITGHSLGGALANLAAMDLANHIQAKTGALLCATSPIFVVYTFGAPPFCDWELSLQYVRMATVQNYFRAFQVINPFDGVPNVLTPVVGYYGCGLDMIFGDWFCIKHAAVTVLCHRMSKYQSLINAIPASGTWSNNYNKDMRLGNRWTVIGITGIDFVTPVKDLSAAKPPSTITFDNLGCVLGIYNVAGTLQAKVGTMNQKGAIQWDSTNTVVDSGVSPAVKMNNNGQCIVTYYNGGDKTHKSAGLYFRMGTVANGSVTWNGSICYLGAGANPSVAYNDEGFFLFVYTGVGSNSTNLCWTAGKITSPGKIQASPSGGVFVKKNGANPSVAMNNSGLVIETHVLPGSTKLMYQLGQMTNKGNCKWSGSPQQFDTGTFPSVALDDKGDVVVVHQGATNTTTLYYNTAYYAIEKSIEWDNANNGVQICPGTAPKATFNDAGFLLLGYVNNAEYYYIIGKAVFDDFE